MHVTLSSIYTRILKLFIKGKCIYRKYLKFGRETRLVLFMIQKGESRYKIINICNCLTKYFSLPCCQLIEEWSVWAHIVFALFYVVPSSLQMKITVVGYLVCRGLSKQLQSSPAISNSHGKWKFVRHSGVRDIRTRNYYTKPYWKTMGEMGICSR